MTSGRNYNATGLAEGPDVIACFLCITPDSEFPANPQKRNGRHEETRTPDLYRVKVAL